MISMHVGNLIMSHSPNVALQFSGGRDSLAMLLLLQNYWEDLTVYHLDTNDEYPETSELVAKMRAVVPRWNDVQSSSPSVRRVYGLPSDLIPQSTSFLGVPDRIKIIDRNICCYHSIMLPMHEAMVQDKITLILRGQRSKDYPKSPVRNQQTVAGMTIIYPVEDLHDLAINAVVSKQAPKFGIMDPLKYYNEGLTSSPDCMGCTAWLEHKAYYYLKKFYPRRAEGVRTDMIKIYDAVTKEYNRLLHAKEVL